MSAIEVKGLTKTYGNNIAVNDLSLNIEKGKVYGFLGPNGAGKSTTMNIITGYIGATSGQVKILGYDIFKEPEKAKQSIGYLPEMPPLYTEMTVIEYLDFAARLNKIPKEDRKKNIEETLELTKTKEVSNRLIKNLSKGYKQRVGIAQALIGMPEIIILDEPTVGLDPKQIIEIRQLIKELGKKHTVILSSHILSEISEVCDYIFIISQGKLIASGSEEELVEQMAKENILNLEVKGTEKTISKLIKEVEEIEKYNIEKSGNGNKAVSIYTNRKHDVREKIFYLFAENKQPILTMNFKQKSLEDIFIELTKDYKAPEKKNILNFGNKKKVKEKVTMKDVDEEISMLHGDEKETKSEKIQEVEK